VASQLGSAVFSSFGDVVTGAATRVVNGLPLTRALDGALRGMSSAEAARLGIAADASVLALHRSRWGELGGSAGRAGKAADFVLRASGLNAWTEAGRKSFGVELLAHLGDQVKAGTKFAQLNEALKRSLSKYGLTADVWDNVVLRTKPIEKNGAHFLDLDGFGGLVKGLDVGKPFREGAEILSAAESESIIATGRRPHAAIAGRMAEQHRAATVIQDKLRIIRDTENRLREFLSTESEFAMLSGADARVKAISTWGAQRGTLVGEFARMGMLYKSFPLSILFYHLQRGLHAPTIGGKLGYLSSFVAASTIVGAVSIQARELAKGRDIRPMDAPQFWMDALASGGGLSVFEALLESGSGFEKVARQLAGPVPAQLEEAFNLTVGNAIRAATGEDTHLGRDVARYAERNALGTNLWYTRLVVQRWIWNNLQRLLDDDPEGSFRRQEDAAKRWHRGESWWKPGESLPERAPDLSKITRE
jgi:hypothetical protein